MIGYADAGKIALKGHKDSYVSYIYNAGSFWLVVLNLKNLPKGKYLLDPYFKVDKKTGKVSEYSPVKDPDEFKNALKNVVYKAE